MAKSTNCKCEYNFTCGYCLQNAKLYYFSLSDGSYSFQLPAFLSQPSEEKRREAREYNESCKHVEE